MVYNKIDKLEGWILVADGWGVLITVVAGKERESR